MLSIHFYVQYIWNGDIDDIVVYNRILTAQEVKGIYNAPR